MDITPFRNQASMLQNEVNQVLLRLEGEMYKIKQIEVRLKELASAHRNSGKYYQRWLNL